MIQHHRSPDPRPDEHDFDIVDVFATPEGGGNQLAVLPDARGLTDSDMQAIAREFNFAETTFVLPPSNIHHHARFRIFTPLTEMPFAGHPTIGAAAALVSRDLLPLSTSLTVEESVGPITVTVERGTDGGLEAMLSIDATLEEMPPAPSPATLADCLSVTTHTVRDVWFASVGMPFCFAEMTTPAAVDQAELDLASWSRHLANGAAPQIYVYAVQGRSEERRPGPVRELKLELYARMFAPGLGVGEDPATGSAAATLAGALRARSEHDDRAQPASVELTIRQGQRLGRPSDLIATAQASADDGAIIGVRGRVRPFASGTLVR